jgi:hypothetical protein
MNIMPRFGAVGKHGSIAVVERFHRTLKDILRLITVPEDQSRFEQEVTLAINWYNEWRPHDTLKGKTPNKVYFSHPAAHEQPRREPREGWPRGSPCAAPQVDIDGEPGDPIVLEIDCLEGRRQLPIIRTRRAAWASSGRGLRYGYTRWLLVAPLSSILSKIKPLLVVLPALRPSCPHRT